MEDTGIADWLEAITTGDELAIVAWPREGVLVLRADKVVSVAAPEGRGSDAADTGWVTPEPSTRRRVEVTVRFAGILVLTVERVDSVAAPAGRGKLAAETG